MPLCIAVPCAKKMINRDSYHKYSVAFDSEAWP